MWLHGSVDMIPPIRPAVLLGVLTFVAQIGPVFAALPSDSTHLASNDASVDESVIGRPFPVSDSVRTACREVLPDKCDAENALLRKFAEEPRDTVWATDLESKLREYVSTRYPGFSVRALECRKTICAGEVTAVAGEHFDRTLGNDQPVSTLLMGQMGINGYESDAAGRRTAVMLILFTRR
jgi:hypothetical protein